MNIIRPELQLWQGGVNGYFRVEREIRATFSEGNTAAPREYITWLYNRRYSISRRVAETGSITVRIGDPVWASRILLMVNGHDDPNGLGIVPQDDADFSLAHEYHIMSIPVTCGRRLIFKIDQTSDPGFTEAWVPVYFDFPK